jgi:uncharacterized surface protein with fasciclin (FAS1) repeats
MPNIVEIAVSAGNFQSLVAAVQAADLVEALSGPGPFTVFAPDDAAFAKLDSETLDTLLSPEGKETLTNILTYHVVSGKVPASEVVKLHSVTTLGGQTLSIDASDGVKVGTATVTTADIEADNGIIHVIDTVLIPA